ncbi:voltage-gated ClC-type chloride channel ClcB [Escherichia sp. ESNIH1]|uniref:voltage-gated ClC-type chloride channel ClcB n=1 Tax=Escherichia sp. ESNIH1 TaxID=1985876 RepID=UPI000CDDD6F7|nr:voltage-gated ClC-type chloride channel ClcB [Escherichia sp. ESNIH1]POU02337.1 voltage-gated ClC-type chloride channel ClcB [Escherichia sp. ESNIH1]
MQRLHTYPDVQAMFRRLLLAMLIGIVAALAVALFRHAMMLLESLFLSNNSGSLVNAASTLPWWRRLLTPALGGVAAGTLLWAWQRYTRQRPHAPTDYIEALETGDGQFDYASSLVKSLASLLVVVTGSAIGREGAMILLAALAASFFAQRFTPKNEWKLWVACGAAAGMASAYHAPLAGSMFIAEILFGTLMLASLGPVVVAAVLALLTTNLLSDGPAPLYTVHLARQIHALDYSLMLVIGLIAGVCGPLFIWLMESSHQLFLRLRLSPPWQLALGGGIVGLLSLLTPAVWGNGYSVVQGYLLSPPVFATIALVFLCKLTAVLASSGSGAPGGVFTPTLFVGMAIGMLLAHLCGLWLADLQTIAILMGLTGMATLLAATTHAPIMSTLMICEMTGQYTLLPGLLVACVVASVLSRTLRKESIYHHAAEKG